MSLEVTLTKLHGCGNDYLFVDCLERPLEQAAEVARAVCDRRRAIGADGVICIYPSERADFRMEMYNADGSRGEMCGNGIRGLGKYVADRGLAGGDSLSVETDAGVRALELIREGGRVRRVRVNMGMPVLEGRKIPVDADGTIIDHPIEVAGRTWRVTCVSMGNPHCVTFDADPDELDLETIGPAFEHHRLFPARVNTEFIRAESPERLVMRVWERGSGETMACGTGACAAVVAGVLTGRCARRAIVALRGGDLEIEYREDETVVMTGPSVEVFTTTVRLEPAGNGLELGS
ncbi:MAG: diaminopimelate epimerase [Deltaproteobacteria bacterium]|nr:MAG: diaminopimelate epimerase [Deltaproteobacteria bacterium]